MMNSIFAYGTLMRGEVRHGWLKRAGPKGIYNAVVEGVLINIGPYPAMLRGEGEVKGEFYEFEDVEELLPELDRMEGQDYRREEVEADVEGLGRRKAWAYFWTGNAEDGPRIESGDWRRRK